MVSNLTITFFAERFPMGAGTFGATANLCSSVVPSVLICSASCLFSEEADSFCLQEFNPMNADKTAARKSDFFIFSEFLRFLVGFNFKNILTRYKYLLVFYFNEILLFSNILIQ
ncbi:hypothetical protein [Chryseobacterium fistulae]|uniref:hypothetical protein n=1 Tax=Chryseobacterium fistulae TaxID=2675058 RepID=UPI001E2EE7C7|nr:hypothetical protein [Chryseobacterium fistulae]